MSGPVLVTGAAGRIGTWLRGGLPERGWAVRSLDVVPVPDTRPGEEQVVADVTDLAAMIDATQGASAVVHMAGIAGESTWAAISHANIEGTYCALEAIAARAAGLEVFGLSMVTNAAAGITGEKLDHEEVLAAGKAAAGRLGEFLVQFVGRLP